MKLRLIREPTVQETTFGILFINQHFFCHTLEDAIREPKGEIINHTPVEEWKIYGKTAIPQGTYKITMEPSEKFHRMVPYLHDVPGFTGILIHGGKDINDTLGCICIGSNRNGLLLTDSWPKVELITSMLTGQNEISISIENQ